LLEAVPEPASGLHTLRILASTVLSIRTSPWSSHTSSLEEGLGQLRRVRDEQQRLADELT
jgi:hypothetical protein